MSSDLLQALLVEDDEKLARLMSQYLETHSVIVTRETDGARGLDAALRHRFDVVLLDLMLPQKSGLEICRELRAHTDVPIIVITARGEEADRVMGLELGADDYLPKPFSMRELLARMRAVVRRARGQAGPPSRAVQVGPISIDPRALKATIAGRELALTGHEFNLLRVLAERAGTVLTRDQLLSLVTGHNDEAFDRSIDVHISRLRQKLGDDPKHPRFIKTIRGAGYLLSAEGQE